MDDLERLHLEAQKWELKLHDVLHRFLQLETVTLRAVKGFVYCTNELLSYIPENQVYKTVVQQSLYNVLLRISIDEFVKILTDVIEERENDEDLDEDHQLFDVIFRDSGIGQE